MATQKAMIRVDLIKGEYGDCKIGLLEGPVHEVVKRLEELAAKVPEKYQKDVIIDIDVCEYYGSGTALLNVYYYREETNEERKKRLEKSKEHMDAQKKVRREMYEKLKVEFEGEA